MTGCNLHTDNSSCRHLYDTYNFADSVTYDKFCIRTIMGNTNLDSLNLISNNYRVI